MGDNQVVSAMDTPASVNAEQTVENRDESEPQATETVNQSPKDENLNLQGATGEEGSMSPDEAIVEDTVSVVSEAKVLNQGNNSLCNLLVYSSGESSNSEEDSDDSDSYECDSDTPDVVVKKPIQQPAKKKHKEDSLTEALRGIGELRLDDLPPVPDLSKLNLGVKEDECDEIGKISSIVDKLVMVESIPNKPAYNIDTLLFLDNGKQPLGYIFDVIGAVTCPMYAIRFNSKEEIASLNITKGLPVFSAPKSEHTQYVFVQQLLKAKGSDASWKDDLEVPQEYEDFSDDEAEISKRRINPDSRKRNSVEHYKNFEKDMNVKNLIDTRLHKIRDNFEPLAKKQSPGANFKRGYQFQPNYRPNFAMTQANTSSTSCAFPPHFGMPTFMPMPQYGPQPFMPIGPPGFMPGLPPPMPNMPPFNPMQQSVPFPHPPEMVGPMYPNVSVPPPNVSQTKSPHMMYPPDMGLPRPPAQAAGFVPTVPFYDPRVPMWPNFPNAPPHGARQPFPNPSRNYFTKRQ